MAAPNVEIVRGLIAALNDRDIDAMVTSFYSPQAEFVPALQAALEGTIYRGPEEIRAYYDEIYAVWDELGVELAELRDLGELVFAEGRVRARGKTSGLTLDRAWAFVFRLADGKVFSHKNFLDRNEALASAGLTDKTLTD